MPHISVIICSFRRQRFIVPALDSLRAQHYDDFEVIFVDNNSPDETAAICANYRIQYPYFPLRYVLETNQGHSFARNRGIAEAKGAILSFIDDDVEVEPDFTLELNKFFSGHPHVNAAGGRIIPRFEAGRPEWLSHWLEPLYACVDLGDEIRPFKGRKYPFGANMAFRKEVFERYGLFDTELGRKGLSLVGADEKDLFERLKKAGEPILYMPKVSLLHIMPADRGEIPYIRRQAIAVGISEKLRLRNKPAQWLGKVFSEGIKTLGSLILAIGYLSKGRPSAGWMLLRFRFWVGFGFLGGKEK
jgi:glycosyltransferase involved in cell wall biosynthesis